MNTHPHAQSRALIARTYTTNKLRRAAGDFEDSKLGLQLICAAEHAGPICDFAFSASVRPRVAEYLVGIKKQVNAQFAYVNALGRCAANGVEP